MRLHARAQNETVRRYREAAIRARLTLHELEGSDSERGDYCPSELDASSPCGMDIDEEAKF